MAPSGIAPRRKHTMPRKPKAVNPGPDAITCLDDCIEVTQPDKKYLTTEEEDGLRFDIYTSENRPEDPPSDGRWIVDCVPVDELDERWKCTEASGVFRDVATAKRSLRRTMLTDKD